MFILGLFLFLVGHQISTIGSLVYSSMSNTGFYGPSLMALIQASSNALALVFAHYFPDKITFKRLFLSIFIFVVLNTIISYIFDNINPYTFFIRIFVGSLGFGFLLSHSPRLISTNYKIGNQKLQYWLSLSSLVGFSIAPLLADSINKLFVFDLLLIILFCVIMLKGDFNKSLTKIVEINKATPKDEQTFFILNTEKNVLFTAFFTFLLWIFGGFFHVIEVPLLLQKFKISNLYISFVFVTTLVINFLTVYTANTNLVSKYSKKIIVLATILIATSCVIYLNTNSFILVLVTVGIIGSLNGLFNLAQSTILQDIADAKSRLNSIIWMRLTSQIGLMIGALIAGSGIFYNFVENSPNQKNESTSVISKMIFIKLSTLPKDFEPYKNTDSSSMLVLRQVFEPLFHYDSRNNLSPNLVETLNWQNNNKTLEIILKKKIYFSNGDELSASDVKSTLLESKMYLGDSADWAFKYLKTIELVNKNTLRFNFTKPFTLLPAILASPYFFIFKRLKNGELIGTGNYIITEKNMKKVILKLKENSLQGPSLINFEQEFNPNVKYDLSDSDLTNFNQPLERVEVRSLQSVLFIPNLHSNPFKNKSFRCKFINAFSELAPIVYSKWEPMEFGLPFSWNIFSKDKNKTKVTGSVENVNKKISIYFANSVATFDNKLNDTLKQKMKESGFDVSFKNLTIKDLVAKARKNEFDGLMFGFIPDFTHPQAIAGPLFGTKQQYNFSGYSNKGVDSFLENALSESNRLDQNKIYNKIFNDVIDDCAVAFLGSQKVYLYKSKEVHLPELGQLGTLNFNLIKLQKIGMKGNL